MKGKKRGRPADYVKDQQGKPIIGLSWQKADGRYYASHHRPKTYFGTDYETAVKRFREWEAKQGTHEVYMPPIALDVSKPGVVDKLINGEETWSKAAGYRIPETAVFQMITEYLSDPAKARRAAEATGYPLDRLAALPVPKPSISLKTALLNYQNARKMITDNEKRQVRYSWDDFSSFIDANNISDITQKQVEEWVEHLIAKKYSPSMIKTRVGRVLTILRLNSRKLKDDYCDRVIGYIRACELPNANLLNPNPISKEDFLKLVEAGKGQRGDWDAIFYVAMNCCYYGIDIIRLPVKAVDLKAGTITFYRQKENTPRIAVLWDKTRKALQRVLKGRENRTYVFETYKKGPWSIPGFGYRYRQIRELAGIKDVEFSQIRDGAYSAAVNCGNVTEKEAKLLAGHKLAGESDKYVMRNPNGVKAACEAIERHYFG